MIRLTLRSLPVALLYYMRWNKLNLNMRYECQRTVDIVPVLLYLFILSTYWVYQYSAVA